MIKALRVLGLLPLFVSVNVLSMVGEGISFDHKDWQVVCDSKNTCRIAGYQSEEEVNPVSILLQRDYMNAQVTGKVQISNYDKKGQRLDIPKVEMKIDEKSFGTVAISEEGLGQLSTSQTQAILDNAKKLSDISFIFGERIWKVSGSGLTAVLLKADEAQDRVDTRSALIAKGNKIIKRKAVKPVVIQGKRFISLTWKDIDSNSDTAKQIFATLDIQIEDDTPSTQKEINVLQLSVDKTLVRTNCWGGPYNFGCGMWVMNNDFTKVHQEVMEDASSLEDGQIVSVMKERGLGDCWGRTEWTWNGEKFIQTLNSSTGLCRGFAGGAWDLPVINLDVKFDKESKTWD